MAKFGDRVKETTDTTGTGSLDLNGAPTGFRSFADEFTTGDDEISYLIVDDPDAPTEYEFGKGTFTTGSPNTFARDTVEGSSNSGNKVSFTSGTKTIVALPTAADMASVFGDASWGQKNAAVRAITSDDSQVAADDGKLILADASGNSPATLIYTLLAEATADDGFVTTVRNDGASGTVDVDDDAAALIRRLQPGQAVELRCDGSAWHEVSTLLPAYDIAFVAGFDSDMTAEDIAVATYGELVMARAGSFTGEAGYIDTAPEGADAIVDIEKNGTTIYTTKPEFAAGSNTLTAGTLKTDGTEDFVSGDRITFKVTQIGSGASPDVAGAGLRFTARASLG
jgi:hypothetical protein